MRRTVLVAVLAAWAGAAQAVEIAPPEGAEPTALVENAWDTYPLPVAAFGGAEPATRDVSGQAIWQAFRIDRATASTDEIAAFYRTALAAEGFGLVFDCAGMACGGFDFRFGAALLPPPEMRMDVADFVQLSASRPVPAAVVSVLVSRLRDAVYVQTVTVLPEDSGQAPPAAPVAEGETEPGDAPPVAAAPADSPPVASPPAEPTVAAAPAPPPPPPGDAAGLLDRLNRDGRVPVAGLDFATGGTVLSDGSAPALDVMAEMLTAHPDLAVAIVGHSDNVGSLGANIELSRRRAEAVRQALIRRGVAAGRLEARGVGYLAPLRSNATEEGRALNRRVELVLR